GHEERFMVPGRRLLVAVAVAVTAAGCGGATSAPAPSSVTSGAVTAAPSSTASGASGPSGPGVSKVLVIVEENHGLSQVEAGMPYLFGLARQYGYATDYVAVTHPSLPNYLAIAGGSTFGVSDDASPSSHPLPGPSVFGQALAAGRTARLYAESMPSPCDLRASGRYAVKHAPWAYFTAERASCAAGMVPAGTPARGALAGDIATGRLPNVGMLIPNLDHDAHDGTLAQSDSWLHGWLPALLAGPDFTAGRLAVVVTDDENDGAGGNRVLTVVLAPGLHHRVVTAALDHYSLTLFYDQVVGARPLRAAATATSLASAFGLRLASG
ncbi:MAG: alkaline phosphatase family protein, partial [Mycobacteriales bacterium]